MLRPTTVLLSAISLLTSLAAPLSAQGGRGQDSFEGPKLENFTFEAGTFASKKITRGEPGYYVLLPKGHGDDANADKQYPWILWLPGFGGATDVLSRGGAEVLDRMRGEAKMPEVALVVFRAPGRRTTYMNGEAAGDIEDLIVGDLLEHVQKKYRLSSDRKDRAVMGVSAGGFGALKIAMRHPEVWGTVAVHSAAIMPADPAELEGMAESTVQRLLRGSLAQQLGDPIDKDKWAAQMPMGIAAMKKPEDLKGLQIYFDAGTEDNYGFCPPNEELAKVMTKNGHKHLFRKVEGGGHAWSSPMMKDSVATSLRFVGLALQGKDAATELTAEMTKKVEAEHDHGKEKKGSGDK